MQLEKNSTLLFIGDSITDCGRARPVGEKDGLGSGYVGQINAILNAAHPDCSIRVLNTGISGNRVCDLKDRWQPDVLDLNPDWLSIMVGINDVWRQFDNPLNPRQVDLVEYEDTLQELIEQTQSRLQGLVLMTPFYLEANPQDPMRNLMDRYGQVAKKIAEAKQAIFVDTQQAFDQYLAYQPSQSLCGDRVHPNPTGHMILAKAFLDAVGFCWSSD